MESLIATIYLEGGLAAVRPFILRYWEPRSKAMTAARLDRGKDDGVPAMLAAMEGKAAVVAKKPSSVKVTLVRWPYT